MLAPGSRQNESSNIPQARQGYSQINIDGQQITHLTPGTDQNQPSYSMDAIAEFVVVTNRFDATQGRSSGMLANAVTKSGTNDYTGTVAGYFRSDKFNASDFIQNRVVPYQDQQVVTTFGGPIKKDRIHFFGNYEQERQPQTVTFSSPYPAFNLDLLAQKGVQTSGPPGPYGGNMDFKALTVGTSLYLPVFRPGALFYTGDPHGAQGDGEVSGNALEQSLTGVFRFVLHKG